MTTIKRLVRRFDAYTLEVFNPPARRGWNIHLTPLTRRSPARSRR